VAKSGGIAGHGERATLQFRVGKGLNEGHRLPAHT
jgi:hypothetical protein